MVCYQRALPRLVLRLPPKKIVDKKNGIGATICISREILYLPYAEFFRRSSWVRFKLITFHNPENTWRLRKVILSEIWNIEFKTKLRPKIYKKKRKKMVCCNFFQSISQIVGAYSNGTYFVCFRQTNVDGLVGGKNFFTIFF